jgi:APA family basic amino acid/polyamine antiporter
MHSSIHIRPSLRFSDLTVIVISLVIGMGIFRTPAEVAEKAGIPSIFFLAWIVGAVVSMIGALIFAEIGSRYPHAGGFYKIFSYCYHPAFAFMVNWITVISNAASTALVAIMGAEYIAPLIFPELQFDLKVKLITVISVLLLFAVNLFGIKVSARFLKVLMSVKIVLLLFIILSVFFVAEAPDSIMKNVAPLETSDWWSAFSLCFIPVFFTYGGYQQTMNFGGDISHAKRVMPRAIITGMSIVLIIYLLVNFAYYHVC